MIKTAICENNMLDAAIIENLLKQLNYSSLELDIYYSIPELSAYPKNNYNLYIINEELISPANIHLIENIKNTYPEALFIYLTYNKQYDIKNSDFTTFYYITKPITDEKAITIIKKALSQIIYAQKSILLTSQQKSISIKYDDILYIETINRHIIIHTTSETYKTDCETEINVNNLTKHHDNNEFIQIQLNFIVNLKHVKTINLNNLILDNNEQLNISKAYRRIIKQKAAKAE